MTGRHGPWQGRLAPWHRLLAAVGLLVGCGSSDLKVASDPTGPAGDTQRPTDSSDPPPPDSAEPPPEGRVRITEVMYHPVLGDFYSDQHEFIELHNDGGAPVDLTGWSFDDGVSFTFGARQLAPGETLVVAGNAAALAEVYPSLPAEQRV